MKPLVSICCITYNQEQYIEQTIKSFLAQKTTFDFEIIIHDDASSDKTQEIIKKYAKMYPHKIIPILQKENQYSKGINVNIAYTYPKARGKYIALCEGDDYWCDENKLQKQVVVFENNQNCTFCFSNGYSFNQKTGKIIPFLPREKGEEAVSSFSHFMNLRENLEYSFIPTASFMFRRETLECLPKEFQIDCPTGDLKTRLFMIGKNEAYYCKDKMVVYRENTPGSVMASWKNVSRKKTYDNFKSIVDMLERFDKYTEYEYSNAIKVYEMPYRKAMLLNTKSIFDLFQRENRIVYEKCQLKDKLKIVIKLMIPDVLYNLLKNNKVVKL